MGTEYRLGLNAARQRLRRFGRVIGERTRSAAGPVPKCFVDAMTLEKMKEKKNGQNSCP